MSGRSSEKDRLLTRKMTYLRFHLLFNVPALALLLWLTRRKLAADHWKWIATICAIVLIVTGPWDCWAVHEQIWNFDWSRVTPLSVRFLGTAWRLPAEEYAFFLIETILVSLLTILFLPTRRLRVNAGNMDGGQ